MYANLHRNKIIMGCIEENMSPPKCRHVIWSPVTLASSGERVCTFHNSWQQLGHWLLWRPWPLTFSSENWHNTYSCPAECLYQFLDLYFFCFQVEIYVGQTDRQTDRHTDGRTRRVMQPMGWQHNKLHKLASFYIDHSEWQLTRWCNATASDLRSSVFFVNEDDDEIFVDEAILIFVDETKIVTIIQTISST